MKILGIDPGTLITGYAVIESLTHKVKILDYGIIKMQNKDSLPLRLKKIYDGITEVINEYKPDSLAIETAFYSKNVQSTLKLGHARGVVILAAVNHNIPISEYSPREVKKSVIGSGNASKEQIKFMMKKIFSIKNEFKHLDTSDAIAVAFCHHNSSSLQTRKKKNNQWLHYILSNPGKVKIKH